MSMKYIRDAYKVPAKRGMRVIYEFPNGGKVQGVITGSTGARLRIRLKLEEYPRSMLFHPTYNLTYLEEAAGRL